LLRLAVEFFQYDAAATASDPIALSSSSSVIPLCP
jgi:hypothetical protein